jgi:hypothetical protein
MPFLTTIKRPVGKSSATWRLSVNMDCRIAPTDVSGVSREWSFAATKLERSRWRDGRPERWWLFESLKDSVVAEKGDLCDTTHAANAGELVRRNYAAATIHSYLKAGEHFRQHVGLPLDQLGPDDIRCYHAHLLGERKLY